MHCLPWNLCQCEISTPVPGGLKYIFMDTLHWVCPFMGEQIGALKRKEHLWLTVLIKKETKLTQRSSLSSHVYQNVHCEILMEIY